MFVRRRAVSSWAALLVVSLVLAWSGRARAHLGSTKYIHVDGPRGSDAASRVDVEVTVESVDAALAVGLTEDASPPDVMARAERVREWLARGIRIVSGDDFCEVTPGPAILGTRDERPHVSVSLAFRCPQSSAELALIDETVFPDDRQHEALVYLAGSQESATVLRVGRQRVALGVGATRGRAQLVWDFLVEGGIHFATGYDHVLFLLSLMLGVGIRVRRGDDAPESTPRERATNEAQLAGSAPRAAAFRDLAWLVTAFTLGHSVTLALAALEIVVLPSRPVEIAIAVSIAVVAVATLARPQVRGPLAPTAGLFGLVHGFGFSSVLAAVGLPAGDTALALFAFNLGIEAAQLVFVALVIWPLLASARRPWYVPVVVRGGSALIALCALYWVVERVA